LIYILILLYLILNGFPSISNIDPGLLAVISGMASTALAFATSGIFSNFIAGLLLWIVDPIDIGDIVKIKSYKGVIKSITLTKVVIETLDRIIVEISNSEVVSSKIINYTIKLITRKRFNTFKNQIFSPQDLGTARLDIDIYGDSLKVREENELKDLFKKVSDYSLSEVHTYNFLLRVDYKKFRIKINKLKQVCNKYKEVFGYTPRFHILNIGYEVSLKFRILTLDSNKILNFQAEFAKELAEVILNHD
jgi:hypothetical protein